jgi:hypothetical protein
MWLNKVLTDLPGDVLTSLIAAGILAALAATSRTVRTALFYARHEFELGYTSGWDSCEWDIQWEGFRLTVEAQGVHNDYIETVIIKKNGENPGVTIAPLKTSDSFQSIEGWPVQFKLNSIVRTRPVAGGRVYRLFFVFRRRRW